ncbi:MAG: response regulator transcription factor, partial [Butyricicoccus sp.]|nr:response regulator transcription factor [Butyricicoccus sp.]
MSNNKYKILVIEDEVNIQSIIETILESNGYQVLTAGTCAEGQMMFRSHLPDLVILDLGLPDADGLNFITTVRTFSMIPVIILSARTLEKDKVTALDLGANDYITKPFGTGELLARVRAALRNSRYGAAGTAPGERFVLQDLIIDYDRRTVTVAGEEVRLTQTEYNIVSLLAGHAGKMMTYSAIIQIIWGSNADAG